MMTVDFKKNRLAGIAFLATAFLWAGPALGQSDPASTFIMEGTDSITQSGPFTGNLIIGPVDGNSGIKVTLRSDTQLNVGGNLVLDGDRNPAGSPNRLIFESGTSTTADITGDFIVQGRNEISMGSQSTLAIGGDLGYDLNYPLESTWIIEHLTVGGRASFDNADVTFKQDATFGKGLRFNGSTIKVSDDVTLTDNGTNSDTWVTDSVVTLGTGSSIDTNRNLNIETGSKLYAGADNDITVGRNVDVEGGSRLYLGQGSSLTASGRHISFGYDGRLQLNGSASLSVTGGGVFFENSGTVDVGLNTLDIDGDAYFLTGSTYKLTRTDSATGRINVTGQVAIGGAIEGGDGENYNTYVYTPGKAATVIISGSQAVNDTNKVILTADGGFANDAVFYNPLFSFKREGDNLLIDQYKGSGAVISEVVAATGAGTTSNYASAATLMDRIQGDTAGTAGLEALKSRLLDNLQKISTAVANNPTQAETALKQLIGEEVLPVVNAYYDTMSKSNATLNSRFQAIHRNITPAAGYGPAENRVWAGGFGQWGRQKNTDNVFGYDYNAAGVMLGYDREVAALPGLTLGLSGSWADGTLKNNDGLAETDIQSFGLGVYGVYQFGNGFFLDADLGYGHATNEATMDLALGGRKTGDFSSDSFQAGLNFGYDVQLGEATTLTPSAGLRYAHIKQNGWREKIVSDPDNMAVANWFGDSKHNFLEIPLTLKLATNIETSGGAVISPELRVGGVIAANTPTSELRMGFVGSDDSAAIYGIEPGRSRFTAGAGVKAQINDTVDIFASYDLESRGGYKGHSASVGLGFSF